MRGTIKKSIEDRHFGFIHADNGQEVFFHASAVAGQAFASRLWVKQWSLTWSAVRKDQRPPTFVHSTSSRFPERAMRLQYMGFEQVKNIRAYLFHGSAPGEETKVFVVTTDLALFLKHHLGMQEGPAMCLRKLAGELGAVESAEPPPLRRALTDQDMFGYIAAGGFFAKRKHGPKPHISK